MRSFAEVLPYAGLVANGVMITKDAQLMRTARVRARDLDYAENYQVAQCLRNVNNSFRFLGEDWTLYIDSIRRRVGVPTGYYSETTPPAAREFDAFRQEAIGSFFQTEFYVTLVFSIEEKKGGHRLLFKRSNGAEDNISADVARFVNTTDDIFGLYASAFEELRILESSELLTYLHGCFGKHHPVSVPEVPFYLDWYLSDARMVPDSVCRIDDDYIVTGSIHDFPGTTHVGMMNALMRVPGAFRISTRFRFVSKDKARAAIKRIRSADFKKRKGVGAIFSEAVTKEETQLEDTEALARAGESSAALESLSEGDMQFGYATTAIVVRDSSHARARATLERVRKVVNELGFVCKEETLNNPLAFLGSLPGNLKFNPRAPLISTRNLTHFFPISATWAGVWRNDHLFEVLGVDYPHMVTRSGSGSFYLNLNVGDVGHTLIVGPTGAGKSILLNTLALQWLRYPGVRVVFFDKDRSSQAACQNAGGLFYEIGAESAAGSIKLNPFGDIALKEHRIWLSQFIGNFIRMKGFAVTPEKEEELFKALNTMVDMNPADLNFTTFQSAVQDHEIRASLNAFTEGEFSELFSSGYDDFEVSTWTTFEMNALMQMGEEVVRFVLGYLFAKLGRMFDGTPTLLVLDEAWLFLDHEVFRSMLRDWLKTLRKKNVYVVLATQEIADARSTIFSTIVNACLTKILLPNVQAGQTENAALYRDLGCTDGDIDALREAQPKRDYFYLSPKGRQMFDLALDPTQLAILKTVHAPREAAV